MLVSSDTLASIHAFAGRNADELARRLQSIESFIRAWTRNDFAVRAMRFSCASQNGQLQGASPYCPEGATVQITRSGINDGLYTVDSISASTTVLSSQLYDAPHNLVTRVAYPVDVIDGALALLDWEQRQRKSAGLRSETISRYKVSYREDDAFGYPRQLLGFLRPYMKAGV